MNIWDSFFRGRCFRKLPVSQLLLDDQHRASRQWRDTTYPEQISILQNASKIILLVSDHFTKQTWKIVCSPFERAVAFVGLLLGLVGESVPEPQEENRNCGYGVMNWAQGGCPKQM